MIEIKSYLPDASHFESLPSLASPIVKKSAIIGAAVIGTGIAAYYLYRKASKVVAEKIQDITADNIVLALSFDNSKLTPQERKDKARLIHIRENILTTLGTMGNLSPLSLVEYNSVKTIFTELDTWRPKLEEEALPISAMDQLIIDQVTKQFIANLTLSRKPDQTCSPQEKQDKLALIKKRDAILQTVHDKIVLKKNNSTGIQGTRYDLMEQGIVIIQGWLQGQKPTVAQLWRYAATALQAKQTTP